MEVGSGGSGVGSTEPHRRRLDGADREAQEPTSPAVKRKTSGGAGFAGAEAGTGENITIRPGRRVTLLTDTAELAVTESVYGPGEKGPDPHVHHEHTDAFIVVEGRSRSLFATDRSRRRAEPSSPSPPTSSTPFATRARRPSVSSTSTPRRAASATTSVAGTLASTSTSRRSTAVATPHPWSWFASLARFAE